MAVKYGSIWTGEDHAMLVHGQPREVIRISALKAALEMATSEIMVGGG